MDGGKELLSMRYGIDGGDGKTKVVARFGDDIKPYAHDVVAFIEVNKKDLFEDKQTNEDACVKRVNFVSKVYTKWMMMSENTTAWMEVDIRDLIESELHPSYNLSSFLSDYRVVSQLNTEFHTYILRGKILK
eukprot:960994_1